MAAQALTSRLTVIFSRFNFKICIIYCTLPSSRKGLRQLTEIYNHEKLIQLLLWLKKFCRKWKKKKVLKFSFSLQSELFKMITLFYNKQTFLVIEYS